MSKKKFKVGDKIRFVYNNRDKGKIGTVVGIQEVRWAIDKIRYLVLIPTTSSYHSGYTKDGVEYTWRCLESQIERVIQKGEQLLFNFMVD